MSDIKIGEPYNTNSDIIVKEVHRAYSKLPAKGKPSVRSNGAKEWTVIASVFAIIDDDQRNPTDVINSNNVNVLSIATGVKTIPDELINTNQNKGYLVHDSHAEILALRLFNYYLLYELLRLENFHSKTVQAINPKIGIIEKCMGCVKGYQIKKSIKLGLYISELPCGDSSMNDVTVDKTVEDAKDKAWDSKRIKTKNHTGGLVRGRAGYSELGCIRTKPGRADSVVSLSKSCSDKLAIKQYIGILNSISSLFVNPIYLDVLILPRMKIDAYSGSIKRCFYDRFRFSDKELYEKSLDSYILKYFQIWGTSMLFEHGKYEGIIDEGCVDSILYLPIYNFGMGNDFANKKMKFLFEVINNGVKLGCRSKKEKLFVKQSSSSMISSRKLAELIYPLYKQMEVHEDVFDIEKIKNDIMSTRPIAKKLARSKLGEWIPTSHDYFSIY